MPNELDPTLYDMQDDEDDDLWDLTLPPEPKTKEESSKEKAKEFSLILDALKEFIPSIQLPKLDFSGITFPPFPEIKIPEIKLPTIIIPEIKVPTINVPEPKVIVNIPEPTVIIKDQKEISVKGFPEFSKKLLTKLDEDKNIEYTIDNPMPVVLTFEGEIYKSIQKALRGSSISGDTGSSGVKDAVKDTLDHFKIADIDDTATTKYYGFSDKDENWYILREDTTAKTYRYFRGSLNYSTAWTNRVSHSYNYYHIIF